jgi:hypothetical protein
VLSFAQAAARRLIAIDEFLPTLAFYRKEEEMRLYGLSIDCQAQQSCAGRCNIATTRCNKASYSWQHALPSR